MCEYVGCLSVCLFILCLFTSYKSQELMTDGCHGNSSSWYRVLKDTQDKHRNTFQHEYLAPLRNNFTLVTTGHSPTHLLITHSLTHTHSPTHLYSLTHTLTHLPTYTHSLTHYWAAAVRDLLFDPALPHTRWRLLLKLVLWLLSMSSSLPPTLVWVLRRLRSFKLCRLLPRSHVGPLRYWSVGTHTTLVLVLS